MKIDKLALFYYLKERADALQVDMTTENISIVGLSEEIMQRGRAVALYELARDVLDVNWEGHIAEIEERRRIEAHVASMKEVTDARASIYDEE